MVVKTTKISLQSKGFNDIIDITNSVAEAIKESMLSSGIATVFIPGSTGGITTIEYEPGLLKDILEMLEKIAPQNARYHHDQTWHDGNGFSHVRSALIKASLTIPFVDSALTLGTWQQIVFIDFDNRPRERTLICQIIGE